MKKYLFFIDENTHDYYFYNIGMGVKVEVEIKKEQIEIEISSTNGSGVNSTIQWPVEYAEKTEILFSSKQENILHDCLAQYIGISLREFLLSNDPDNTVFDSDEAERQWKQIVCNFLKTKVIQPIKD